METGCTSPSIPVARPKLPDLAALSPYLGRLDEARVYSNHGALVVALEDRLSGLLNLPDRHAITCSSGSMALIGAILAVRDQAGGSAGQVCLMPAYSFVATAAAAELCGYRTRLVDVDSETWSLDPGRLSGHPEIARAGLVIAVAPYGRPIDLEAWQRFHDETGIPVLIDAAAGFDWFLSGGAALPAGLPVAVSLHATKAFGCGEGGLILTRDTDLARRCFRAVNHGFLGSRDAVLPGINGKMSEYHAAVALAELDGWEGKLARMRQVGRQYRQMWSAAGSAAGRLWATPDISGCYALFEAATPDQARDAAATLDRAGVDTRFWYGTGLQDHSAYAHLDRDDLSGTADISQRLLGLPCYPDLSVDGIERVVTALS